MEHAGDTRQPGSPASPTRTSTWKSVAASPLQWQPSRARAIAVAAFALTRDDDSTNIQVLD